MIIEFNSLQYFEVELSCHTGPNSIDNADIDFNWFTILSLILNSGNSFIDQYIDPCCCADTDIDLILFIILILLIDLINLFNPNSNASINNKLGVVIFSFNLL